MMTYEMFKEIVTEQNKEMLREIPYRDFKGLSIIYRYAVVYKKVKQKFIDFEKIIQVEIIA